MSRINVGKNNWADDADFSGRVVNNSYFHIAAGAAADGLVAHSGGGQGSATACGAGLTVFATVASDHDSGILNVAVTGGMLQPVTNLGANILDIYPPVGGKIDGGSTNAPVSIDPGTSALFVSRDDGSGGKSFVWL